MLKSRSFSSVDKFVKEFGQVNSGFAPQQNQHGSELGFSNLLHTTTTTPITNNNNNRNSSQSFFLNSGDSNAAKRLADSLASCLGDSLDFELLFPTVQSCSCNTEQKALIQHSLHHGSTPEGTPPLTPTPEPSFRNNTLRTPTLKHKICSLDNDDIFENLYTNHLRKTNKSPIIPPANAASFSPITRNTTLSPATPSDGKCHCVAFRLSPYFTDDDEYINCLNAWACEKINYETFLNIDDYIEDDDDDDDDDDYNCKPSSQNITDNNDEYLSHLKVNLVSVHGIVWLVAHFSTTKFVDQTALLNINNLRNNLTGSISSRHERSYIQVFVSQLRRLALAWQTDANH
eukprot:Awhi_evm1s3679